MCDVCICVRERECVCMCDPPYFAEYLNMLGRTPMNMGTFCACVCICVKE